MLQDFVKWLPLIVTLIAGFFAIYQIRVNNITNARLKWLDSLRLQLSDFFSECTIFIIKKGIEKEIDYIETLGETSEESKAYSKKIFETTLDHLKIISGKHDLIRLNLNPIENIHIKFEEMLDHYMDLINKIPETKNENYNELSKEMRNYSERLIYLSRYIMKLEWEKTKRYFTYWYYSKYGKGKKLLKRALLLN